MLRALLDRLAERHVTIGTCRSKEIPLLTRWIFRLPKWVRRFLPVETIYVHLLESSDEDRALHDHPWPFYTFLLSSGYWEHTPQGRFWRPRFSFLYRPAEWQHRLELVRPTWTIVFRGARFRQWGFIFPDGTWQDWESYGSAHCEEDRVYREHARRRHSEDDQRRHT